MKKMTIWRMLLAVGLVIIPKGAVLAQDRPNVSREQAAEIATEVYIYGYPLVTLEMTRRVTTNTAAPVGMRAPMGQFAHARKYPSTTYRDIPGANADTL